MNEALPKLILACTLRGTILIAFAALVGPLARRFFGRNGAHCLWIVAALALLWPLPPRTALSLQNLWAMKKGAPLAENANGDSAAGLSGAMPLMFKIHMLEKKPETASEFPAATAPNEKAAGVRLSPTQTASRWLAGVWLCGVIIALAQLGWRWFGTLRLLRDARPVSEERADAFLRRFARGHRVRLVIVSAVRAPALAGIWRPRILIPEGWLEELSTADLESVLLHELGHHLRGDLVWEWAFAIARCLHWMNPAVWLAERMARNERELACDAWALERSAQPAQYGEALLAALKRVHRCPAATFGVAAMADDARQIARRLQWITRYRPSSRWLSAAAWAPALLVLAAVGTDPLAAEADGTVPANTPPTSGAEATPVAGSTPSTDEPLPLTKRSVELTTRFIRVPESVARRLGWPVAEQETAEVQQILSQADFRQILTSLKSTPGVEFIPGPRMVSRNGAEGRASFTREFRYGFDYKPSAAGFAAPGSVGSSTLGMWTNWTAKIKDENAVHLSLRQEIFRLAGFADNNGHLTKPLAPPAGASWQQRLVAYEMPPGVGGEPSFVSQLSKVDFDLTSEQAAITFGFRDADQTPAPGGSKGESTILYFAVQFGILP